MLNLRLQSVEGISKDFLYLNLIGYLCYTTSMCMFYFNPFIREEFYTTHKYYPLVKVNDLAYTVHGLICVLIVFYQVNYSTSFKKGKHQHVSSPVKYLIIAIICFCGWTIGNVLFLGEHSSYTLLEVAQLLGYLKVFMSLTKYIPQLIHNHRRKSTKGWAINSTILDVVGGVSSLSQLYLDAYLGNPDTGKLMIWKGVWDGNRSKMLLSLVTMIFDFFFLFQHYVLFANKKRNVISLDDFKG